MNFFLTVKQSYFASWSDELAYQTQNPDDTKNKSHLAKARVFWSFYSLFTTRIQKYFSERMVRTLSFYAEILNLMGNVMAWTIFLNSQKGKSLLPQDYPAILGYVFTIGFSYVTATLSFYMTIGAINLCRIRVLRTHFSKIEVGKPSSTKKLSGWEFYFMVICVLMILAWLALFAVLSNILLKSEIKYWLGCSLGTVIFSYLVMDALMVLIYRMFKPKMMLLMLAMRTLNSEYLSLSATKKDLHNLHGDTKKPQEKNKKQTNKQEEKTRVNQN